MAVSINPKVYALPSAVKPSATRALTSTGGQADSTSRTSSDAAQAFIDNLPKDVRGKVGRQAHNPYRDQSSGFTQKSDQDAPPRKTARETVRSFDEGDQDFAPVYTAPILTPGATLVQAQMSSLSDVYQAPSDKPSSHMIEAMNDAYISAGAQKGGSAAAMEAAIQREQNGTPVQVVPPVLTSVNFTA